MIYTYTFNVWPDETWKMDKAMYSLFTLLNTSRVEIQATKEEFETFRSGLSHHGITLREVERWPYVLPEHVDGTNKND